MTLPSSVLFHTELHGYGDISASQLSGSVHLDFAKQTSCYLEGNVFQLVGACFVSLLYMKSSRMDFYS